MGVADARSGATVDATGQTLVTTTRLDRLVQLIRKYGINWARNYSLWPMPFGTACCAIELMATAASRFDVARFGAEAMRFSPRQSDLLICAGRVPIKLMPVLQRIYIQMTEPKWVISMGACASTGGVFDTYAVVQGIVLCTAVAFIAMNILADAAYRVLNPRMGDG